MLPAAADERAAALSFFESIFAFFTSICSETMFLRSEWKLQSSLAFDALPLLLRVRGGEPSGERVGIDFAV
jgi:hypothetical protein